MGQRGESWIARIELGAVHPVNDAFWIKYRYINDVNQTGLTAHPQSVVTLAAGLATSSPSAAQPRPYRPRTSGVAV
jgi:O-methyltransferase involved in polyketide biosynthesis